MKKLKLFFASIKGRLTLGVVVLHVLLMGIFVYDFIARERHFLLEHSFSRVRDLTLLIASNGSLALVNDDIVSLTELVSQVEHLPDIEIILIMDKNYRVRASNKTAYFNQIFDDPASLGIRKELKGATDSVVQKSHDGVVDTMVPMKIGRETVGYTRIISTTDRIALELKKLFYKGLIYILFAIVIGGTIAWWIVRSLTYRLTKLSQAASQIAQENYNVSLPQFQGDDEISKMGQAFRVMIHSIQDQIATLKSMLIKVQEAETIERERSEQSERYQKALFQWSQINYETPEVAIHNTLEITASTLQIERVSVWLFDTDQGGIVCQDLYNAKNGTHEHGMVLEQAHYPEYFDTLLRGGIIDVQDAQHDPRTSEFTETYLKPLGIQSMLDMPIIQNGKVIGVVCCEQVGSLRGWKPEEQEFMLTIANSIIVSIEIDKRKKTEEILAYQAHHDELTHLYNRALFTDRLEHAIKKARRAQSQVAIMFMDLDHFKEINDSLGHAIGDEVLISVAKKLSENLREIDTIARLGGDEFTLIVEEVDDLQKLNEIALKLISIFQHPILIGNHQLYVTCSIGISLYPLDGDNAQSLLRNADSAMYKAKDEGRNSYQYYTEELTARAFERIALESSLRQAIEKEELVVFYQPKIDGVNETMIGMEALVRWNHPDLGMISPAKFIPIAEETGFIVVIDQWVMHTAMKQIVQWREDGLNPGVVSLNLTKKQLRQEGFLAGMHRMLSESGCRPEWIEMEVTEGDIMKNPEQSIAVLIELRKMGIALALDDFGTGYSSLAYLKRFPITTLKIDQSFICGLPDDNDDTAIVRSTIALAKSMGMEVIAEGVETVEQKDFLIANGCRNIQGYLYGRPIPSSDMSEKLRTRLMQESV
ncbi:MAG: EAL domain-containing protein [Sulfuricurvum sp.]|jgi:diguanylate cyclase (GGDEF)-like protein|uniref:EAL domain-containing protein n=1 Tax=Sulfuricurvum sp. TaxID=2025608 RepID=UPI0025F7FEB4|nr:EAL domain-containing protein [Sulfuricurvum sp.]MCK9372763.1 EAL domain-containing protein [Sulfuricurvum sp.]